MSLRFLLIKPFIDYDFYYPRKFTCFDMTTDTGSSNTALDGSALHSNTTVTTVPAHYGPITTGTTIPAPRLGAQHIVNPVTTFDIDKMKEQLREEIMKELNENQMIQQPLVTGPRYIICKNSLAYICSLTDYLGDTDNWKEIRTTHDNTFTASDEFFMSNKMTLLVDHLAAKLNTTSDKIQFFKKENWIFCCIA